MKSTWDVFLYCHLWPLALPYFSILSQKARFSENRLFNIKYVFCFCVCLLSGIFFILRRNERDVIKNIHLYSCKVPVVIFTFERNSNFLHRFPKSTQISVFRKIYPVGAEFFHADRRTDMNLIVALRNFANAPKNQLMSRRGIIAVFSEIRIKHINSLCEQFMNI